MPQNDNVRQAQAASSEDGDIHIVANYLAGLVAEQFPKKKLMVSYRDADASEQDGKPHFNVFLQQEGKESFKPHIQKVTDHLRECFPDSTVLAHNHLGLFSFDIAGSPAELAGDIQRNDPKRLPPAELSGKFIYYKNNECVFRPAQKPRGLLGFLSGGPKPLGSKDPKEGRSH